MVCIQPLPPPPSPPLPLPPLPTPSPPPRWVGGSPVSIAGKCQSTRGGGCVASQHYPNRYENNETCNISGVPKFPLIVNYFQTEKNHDNLTINGMPYSGVHGPRDVVPADGIILWSADGFQGGNGWELCWGDQPLPPPPPQPPQTQPSPNTQIVVPVTLLVCIVLVAGCCLRRVKFINKRKEKDFKIPT